MSARGVLHLVPVGAAPTFTALASAAGCSVIEGWAPDPRGESSPPASGLHVGTVDDDAGAAGLLSALVAGASAAVLLNGDAYGPRVADAARRVAQVVDWRDDPVLSLPPPQVELLLLLGRGSTMAAAAEAVHVSLRTADRLVVRAVDTLGAVTRTEAIATVRAATQRLSTS